MLATHGSNVLMMSVVGHGSDIKAARALMTAANSDKTQVVAAGPKLLKAKLNPAVANYHEKQPWSPGRLWPRPGGYLVQNVRLEYGLYQSMFVSKDPGFMISATDEACWAILKSDQFTTPILREWLPYIKGELTTKGLLSYCDVAPHSLECAILEATTADIDAIVSDGLSSKKLLITETS
jgi:hypothetical protein